MTTKTFLYEISEMFQFMAMLPGWIKSLGPVASQIRTLRKALGMSQTQLAARSGMRQSVIANLENTPNHDMRLSTLRSLAAALDCEAVIALVPKKDIVQNLNERAEILAKETFDRTVGSNAIELQKPSEKYIALSLEEMKREILEKHRSSLWKD